MGLYNGARIRFLFVTPFSFLVILNKCLSMDRWVNHELVVTHVGLGHNGEPNTSVSGTFNTRKCYCHYTQQQALERNQLLVLQSLEMENVAVKRGENIKKPTLNMDLLIPLPMVSSTHSL